MLSTSLEYLSTSYSMNFLALHDDVKFIIAMHLASDLKIRKLLSKNHDIQKILFNEAVCNDDLNNYINLQYNAKENDNFKNAKIFKIHQDLSYTSIRMYVYTYVRIIHTCYVLIKPSMPIHYVLVAVFASCFYVLKSLLHE